MTPHHQTFRGNEASDGAGLGAHSYSTLLRAEILPTVRTFAREVGIAVSVALFCSVPVLAVVIYSAWRGQL